MKSLLCVSACMLFFAMSGGLLMAASPNILWFVVDDMSANFSCYGETAIQTPNVDRLAAEGTRFSRAYVTAPVCSTCRSAFITGMYQTSIGAHHHRSGRGALKIQLPPEVPAIPKLFQQAGYYTCIGSGLLNKDARGLPVASRGNVEQNAKRRLGKTDYNFEWDATMYDGPDWSGRKANQPFFMQVQLPGGKLRGSDQKSFSRIQQRAKAELGSATDPEVVVLPPHYPRAPVLLSDWAAYLDSVRLTDQHVGEVIGRLSGEGLMENTLILFMTDHGISHARGKQFLFDEGTHVPFVVCGLGIPRGAMRSDLIEHIDMAAISLAAAGIPIPPNMQARDIFAMDYEPRQAVFAARDRCDETVDRIRSVRTDQFLYIRNFLPQRPLLQPNAYKDHKQILQVLRRDHEQGLLPDISEQLLFSSTREPEELYRYNEDSWQVRNLAADPAFRKELEAHRVRLDQWLVETNDHGFESEAMYDSDMAEYQKKQNPVVDQNIAIMKAWAKAGK